MRIALLIVALLVATVLWNSGPVPVDPPWRAYIMPKTPEACHALNGEWVGVSSAFNPFTVEADHTPEHCALYYADEGASCTNAMACKSRICIVHPVTRQGHCLGMLPPRGRFEYLDPKGNVRYIELPL